MGFLLVGAIATVAVLRGGGGGGGGGEALNVRLVPAADPGASPFTADVSTVSDADVGTVRAIGADLLSSATDGSGGLEVQELAADADAPAYGTATEAVCDVYALVAALETDPAALAAWADLMGVEPDIESAATALGRLTPLLLAHDTAVTNRACDGGTARTFQAILQAGTAVLVDGSGTPRVKCSCGNPLLPPAITGSVQIEGDPWEGFDERTVVAIDELGDSGGIVRAIEATTGEVGEVELSGGAGESDVGDVDTVELDGYLVDDADGVYVSDVEGNRTEVLDGAVAAVFDDGAGGLIFQRQRTSEMELYARWDTLYRRPPDVDAASIWHLRAGEAEPVLLLTAADPRRHWFALEDVEPGPNGARIAFQELRDPPSATPRDAWSSAPRRAPSSTSRRGRSNQCPRGSAARGACSASVRRSSWTDGGSTTTSGRSTCARTAPAAVSSATAASSFERSSTAIASSPSRTTTA